MFKAVLYSALFTFGLTACSDAADAQKPVPTDVTKTEVSLDADTIRTKVQAALNPQAVLQPLEEGDIPGFYTGRITNGPVLYISKDSEYLFSGDAYQIDDGRLVDITEKRAAVEREQLVKSIDKSTEIAFSPNGETKAVIHVFTDVDCGYCRKLHQEMADYNAAGIEVRYLAYPRAGVGSPSYKKIASAWCASDKQFALTELKNLKQIPENVCDGNPVADHYALGGRMGVRGTPAILLEDGRLLPGYRPANVLAQELGI